MLRERREQFFLRYPSAGKFLKGYGDMTSLIEGIYVGEKDSDIFKEVYLNVVRDGKRTEPELLEFGSQCVKYMMSEDPTIRPSGGLKGHFPKVGVLRLLIKEGLAKKAVPMLSKFRHGSYTIRYLVPGWSSGGVKWELKMFRLMIEIGLDNLKEYSNIWARITGVARELDHYHHFPETITAIRKHLNPKGHKVIPLKNMRKFLRTWDQIEGRFLDLKYGTGGGVIEWESPFNDGVTINGHQFTPITCIRDIQKEGREMSHCVGSYWRACVRPIGDALSHIYKITGPTRATLEIWENINDARKGATWSISQLQGPGNSHIHDATLREGVAELIQRAAYNYNKASAIKKRERSIENINDEVAPHMYHESWDYLVQYFPALETVRHTDDNQR